MTEAVAAPGPQTRIDPAVEARLAKAGRAARWIATIFSLFATLALAIPALSGLLPPGPEFVRSLSPATGVALSLLGIGAQLAGDTNRTVESSVGWRRVGVVLALFVAAFGVYVAAIFLFDRIDLWFASPLDLPSFSVALALVLIGVAVPLMISRLEYRVLMGQIAGFLVFSLSAVIFLGYTIGDPSVGRLFRRPEISFHASMSSLLLSIGVLLTRPGSGLLSTASSPGAGGRLLRRFGPLVLFMPAILLLVAETMPTSERVDTLAMSSVGLGLLLLVMLGLVVRALDQTAAEAATAAAQAERARIGLSQEAPLVSQFAEMLHMADLESVAGWDVATRFRPGRGSVTGDASSVRSLPDGDIGVVLVDVTGHGADPAIRGLRVRDLLFHSMVEGRSPAQAIERVSWSLPGDELATAIVVRVTPATGDVVMASAGHPPAIHLKPQDAELLGPTGPLLFLQPDARFDESKLVMSPGHSLVLVSDGVADVQRHLNGRTEPQILADLLLAEGGVASRTAELVLGFADNHPRDDQTVVVLNRRT